MNAIGTIINAIVALWLLVLTLALYRIYRLKQGVYDMATAWGRQAGLASGEKRREAAQSKHVASGQVKIMDTLAEQIPGAGTLLKSSGLNDSEAWALITDKNTLNGIKVIMETVGGALKLITPKEDGGRKTRKNVRGQTAPLIEYRE